MKIHLKNLGPLEQAEFSLGELTIICGQNNTGKTYATYALFGFLSYWREAFTIDVPEPKITQLLSEGTVSIDVSPYVLEASHTLSEGCTAFTRQLPRVFASDKERFTHADFSITLGTTDIQLGAFERRTKSANTDLFILSKRQDSSELIVTLLIETERVKVPKDIVADIIGDALKEIIFGHLFPNVFIASAERTGAAIFRKELHFARNRLLEEMGQKDNKSIDPLDLFMKVYQDYALPVTRNVDFTRNLESISKSKSFLSEMHPEILADFTDIIGGEYMVTRSDELYYVPQGKRIRLSMDESSSAVRSLLDIGFYLRHVAKLGDLLIIDEPELNLHPENQRRVARLFARLVNLGIKIFITTHSDYIIKELNTLILLNQNKPHLKELADREGYKHSELLSPSKVKVYIAEKALVMKDGKGRRSSCQTFTNASIDPALGIEVQSFDSSIDAINRIQEEIIWSDQNE